MIKGIYQPVSTNQGDDVFLLSAKEWKWLLAGRAVPLDEPNLIMSKTMGLNYENNSSLLL
jgi:hypothetical protein